MSALSLFLLSSEAEKLSGPLELELTGCELLCGRWEQNSRLHWLAVSSDPGYFSVNLFLVTNSSFLFHPQVGEKSVLSSCRVLAGLLSFCVLSLRFTGVVY